VALRETCKGHGISYKLLKDILFEKQEKIAVLTLNRPDMMASRKKR
jgi:hypothetical protein